jgi:hypothetical protein
MMQALKESKVNLARMVILALQVPLAKLDLREFKESKVNKDPLEVLAVLVPKERLVQSVQLDRKENLARLANLESLDLKDPLGKRDRSDPLEKRVQSEKLVQLVQLARQDLKLLRTPHPPTQPLRPTANQLPTATGIVIGKEKSLTHMHQTPHKIIS